jgi:hypothetical protein
MKTLTDLVSACASASILLTVYSIDENLPVRLSLLEPMEEQEMIGESVLLRIDDCICAYLLLLISSRLFIFYVTNK